MRGGILRKGVFIAVNMFDFNSCFAGIAHYVITGKERTTEEEEFALFLLDSLRYNTQSLDGVPDLAYAKELGLQTPEFPLGHISINPEQVLQYVKEILTINGRSNG